MLQTFLNNFLLKASMAKAKTNKITSLLIICQWFKNCDCLQFLFSNPTNCPIVLVHMMQQIFVLHVHWLVFNKNVPTKSGWMLMLNLRELGLKNK